MNAQWDELVTNWVRPGSCCSGESAAGLPYGGGKAGICADPAMGRAGKERLVRSFAQAIGTLTDYIPGPDMGTDETCIGWVHDEIGRAVGMPAVLGGSRWTRSAPRSWGWPPAPKPSRRPATCALPVPGWRSRGSGRWAATPPGS